MKPDPEREKTVFLDFWIRSTFTYYGNQCESQSCVNNTYGTVEITEPGERDDYLLLFLKSKYIHPLIKTTTGTVIFFRRLSVSRRTCGWKSAEPSGTFLYQLYCKLRAEDTRIIRCQHQPVLDYLQILSETANNARRSAVKFCTLPVQNYRMLSRHMSSLLLKKSNSLVEITTDASISLIKTDRITLR
jgi:hypothetical protein